MKVATQGKFMLSNIDIFIRASDRRQTHQLFIPDSPRLHHHCRPHHHQPHHHQRHYHRHHHYNHRRTVLIGEVRSENSIQIQSHCLGHHLGHVCCLGHHPGQSKVSTVLHASLMPLFRENKRNSAK